MKRIVSIMLGILTVICCQAQKVDVKIDDFTGEKTIVTSWEKIYSGGMTGSKQTRLQIKQTENAQYMIFRVFTDCVASINKGDEVFFKTSEGLVKATVTDYSISEHGAWAPNAPNSKLGIYFVTKADLGDFKGTIEKIRIPLSVGNYDLTLNKKDSEKIYKLIDLVLQAEK